MTEFTDWIAGIWQSMTDPLSDIGEYLPLLGAALLLMILGWFVARLSRTAFVRGGAALNDVLDRFGRAAGQGGVRLSPRVVTLLGNVAFWIIVLLFSALAARTARLDAFSGWLDRIVAYLPTLVAGGLIALAGYLVSTLVRDVVSAALVSAGTTQTELLAFLAQSAVFLTAVVIGLDQIGIDVTFLITLLAVVVGGTLISLAIAFGLGARMFVSNLIAANQAHRILETGQLVEIGDTKGRVLELTSTSVVLLTEAGRTVIPAHLTQELPVAVLADRDDE
jgi:hypothetical protein